FDTAFQEDEYLHVTYGGFPIDTPDRVKSETIRGSCASCGGSGGNGSISKQYYYLRASAEPLHNQNQVYWIVIKDTVARTTGMYRTVYGLEENGRLLRKAFIKDPVSETPTFWCESWKLAVPDVNMPKLYRVAEHRMPSAHNVDKNSIDEFLNPYDGTDWDND